MVTSSTIVTRIPQWPNPCPFLARSQHNAQAPKVCGLIVAQGRTGGIWDLQNAEKSVLVLQKNGKNMTGFYIFYSFWWLLMFFFFMGLLYPDTRWHQPWSNIECPATSGAQYMAVPMRAVRRRCKPGHWRLPLGHGPGAPIRTTNHGLLILKACDFWIFLVRYV